LIQNQSYQLYRPTVQVHAARFVKLKWFL